jgi:DNA-3-methyladenine glycosylase II
VTDTDIRRAHRAAVRHLEQSDPVLARIIAQVGTCRLVTRREGSHFDALVRAILYQQLSGKAAATIHQRMLDIYGGRNPSPEELVATDDARLRAAGVSRQKIGYLKDLAAKVVAREVDLEVDALGDDEILEQLVRVKGIGRWTVQMFLMFRLGRPDVLPELDLGIQNAIKRAYRRRGRVKPKDVLRIGAKWRPHASVACWYLWRSLEITTPGS